MDDTLSSQGHCFSLVETELPLFLKPGQLAGIRAVPAPTQTVPGRASVLRDSDLSLYSLCWSQCKHRTDTDSFRFKWLVLCSQGPHSPLGSQPTKPEARATQAALYGLCPPWWEKRSTTPGSQSDGRAAPTLPCQRSPSRYRPPSALDFQSCVAAGN